MSSMRQYRGSAGAVASGCLRRWLLIQWHLSGIDVLDDAAMLSSMGGQPGCAQRAPGAGAAVDSGGVRRAGGRHPEATAITFAGQSLTYAEVDAASNRLAHHLVDRGVRGGVWGLLPRSAEAIVAILAVLKCGRGLCADLIRPIPMNGSASCSPMPRRWW